MPLSIPLGHKFAIAAASVGWIASSLPEELIIGNIQIYRKLPIQLSDFWKEHLGRLQIDELKSADLFVVTHEMSAAPAVLDAENRMLLDRVWRFYFGVIIGTPYIGHSRGLKMSGATEGASPNVRQVQAFDHLVWMLGFPRTDLDQQHFRTAYQISAAIADLAGRNEHSRFWRVTHAFYGALRSDEAGQRIHQFVRCIEGFIVPDPGKTEKQFVSRTELFVGPGNHELMRHLFRIRSAVEHLHGPLSVIAGGSERERRLLLLQRSLEAESVARYCLCNLLLNPSLHGFFRSDEALDEFWSLDAGDRAKAWGPPMDIADSSAAFNSRYVEDDDLGLK